MWRTVRLGDVCELAYGKALDKADRLESDGYPAFGANGVKTRSKAPLYDKPSIIIGRKGSAGEINKVTEPFWALDVTYYTKVDDNVIALDYLFYVLTTLNLPSLAKGVKPGINRNDVYEQHVPLPPIAEQQRIVAKLDAAFAEIDRAVGVDRERVARIISLEQALLEATFSADYPSTNIGDLGDVKSGGTPKSKEPTYWGGSIQWYSSGELNSLYTSPSEKRITSEGLNNSNAKLFPRGTLLIGMYDTAAMKMSILHEEATFNQAIVGVPPNEFASSEYLFYALQYLKPQILMERRGVRQQNLSLAKIKKIEIPIPDAPSQKQIVTRFRALSRLKESIFSISIKKLNEYQSLKSSILAQELQPTQSEAA